MTNNLFAVGSPMLILGAMEAQESGKMVGQAVSWLLLAAGALKCWAISYRATTNRKCALALMLVLVGYLTSSVGTATRDNVLQSEARAVVSAVTVTLLLGLVVAAIVLAILGLREISREPGTYTQGRKQGGWALGLSVLTVLMVVFGFVSGFVSKRGITLGPAKPGQVLTFEEFNFRFRSPGRPWNSINASKFNKASKVGFLRRGPEVFFLVIPEVLGVRQEFTTERLVEVGKAHLEGAADTNYVMSEAPFSVNGLAGTQVETEARLGQQHFYYWHWYYATNGFAYQLIGYGRFEDRAKVAGDIRNLAQNFELIDPHRTAESSGGGFKTNFVSSRFNYSVQVAGSSWHPWTGTAELAEAEFKASRGDSCFAVIPVWLGTETVEIEGLTAGLLATFNVTYPNEDLTGLKKVAEGEVSGVEYEFHRTLKGTEWRYRFKILREGSNAYLVAAWTERRAKDSDATLTEALGRVSFQQGARLLSTVPAITAREQETRAEVFNQAGLYHYQAGEYEKALPLFRAAASADPSKRVHAVNAMMAWEHLKRPKEALEFLAQQAESVRKDPEVRASQAHFQAGASQIEMALTNYAGLFGEGYRDENRFEEFIDLLNNEQQYDRALSAIQEYLKHGESVSVRVMEAEEYQLKKDVAKALELLKRQHERVPLNARVISQLIQTSLDAEQYQEALSLSKEWVRTSSDSAFAHYLQGRSELALKWYREAKTSFEAAARLAPANKDIQAYLAHVSGLLGEGDNSGIKEPLSMVVLPAALTNSALAPPPAGYAKSYGGYYSRRLVAVSFVAGKEYKTTEYLEAQVLDASGVASFSTIQRAFDPLSEQLFVNELQVMDGEGKMLSTGKVADYYVLDDHQGVGASQKKVLNIPVPGLRPGCQMKLTLTRREFGRLEEFPFLEHCFSRSLPVRESVLFIRGDCASLKSISPATTIESKQMEEGRCWRMLEPSVMRWEPLQPPATTFLPTVWIGDSSRQWPVVVSNYLASINERIARDPVLTEQARQLVAGTKEEDSKITALVRHVQTDITYKAIEFGRRARVPNRPLDVMRNKYGDCKDHAVLLQQMLEAIGVPARLALVSHNAPVQKELPSLDQFDHMIVYLPVGGGRFIDCTDKGADAAHAIPYGLAGHYALVLERDMPRFVSIPGYSENASTIEVKQALKIVDNESLQVEETLSFAGVHAAFLRNFFLETPPASQRLWLQRQMGMTDVELTELKAESVENLDRRLVVHCGYLRKRQFHQKGDRLSGTLRGGMAREYVAAGVVDGRSTPFEITIPTSLRIEIALEIPKGFRAEIPAPESPKLDSRFAVCEAQWRAEPGALKLEFGCRQPGGKFEAKDYATYYETMAQSLALLEREVTLRQGE